jgi:hypothetical protein
LYGIIYSPTPTKGNKMKLPTYRMLLNQLKQLSDDQLDCTITFYDSIDGELYSSGLYLADQDASDHDLGCPDCQHPIISTTDVEVDITKPVTTIETITVIR